jgi:phospholipase/carboxylesterase
MRHSARPGDASLHSRLGAPPSIPLDLVFGVHVLAELFGDLPAGPEALLFVPPSLGSANPLLVFFHGAGGAAATSLPLVRAAAEQHDCLVLLPTSVARTWDFLVSGWGPDVERLDAMLQAVLDSVAVSRLAFGGFSDGASYALSIGLANGGLAQTLLAFSPGFAAPPARVGRPRVWISHGTEDGVLPIDRCARPVVRALTGAGYDVRYQEFAGAHVVPPDTVEQGFQWWLAD